MLREELRGEYRIRLDEARRKADSRNHASGTEDTNLLDAGVCDDAVGGMTWSAATRRPSSMDQGIVLTERGGRALSGDQSPEPHGRIRRASVDASETL